MTSFSKLRSQFDANWTTVLVGWKGFDQFSPWPDSKDFPPFLSPDELLAYAEERLGLSDDPIERKLVASLLRLDPGREDKYRILDNLMELSRACGGDSAPEVRKWQIVLLEELLSQLPVDPTQGLLTLSEFWQNFGFPSDGPHEVQGRENNWTPAKYYQPANFRRLLTRHREWIEDQKAILRN